MFDSDEYKYTSQRRSKGGRKNFQVFTATEFIGAITQYIPEKSFQLVQKRLAVAKVNVCQPGMEPRSQARTSD